MPDLQTVRIFLASSDELLPDRDAFELYVRQQNDKWLREKNIRFEVDRWETGFGAISQTRTQDEYNELVRNCDLFVILVFSKLGEYSEEEFNTAYKQFKLKDKPLILTYFKDAPINTSEIDDRILSMLAFRKKLEKIKHFYPWYKSIEDLQLQFTRQLDQLYPPPPENLSEPEVHISRLPDAGGKLFGRASELEMLDEVWENPSCNLIEIIAWGGVGKTALIGSWLNQMAQDNWRGAMRVYAWSFYSQGASDNRQSSAESFLNHALGWMGVAEGDIPKDARERGLLLAKLLRKQPSLLILDGLEPLQYPPGPLTGQLKDRQGLRVLLKELAAHNPGLCIITSRIKVQDLAGSVGTTVCLCELERLNEKAGTALLRHLSVTGPDRELAQTVEEYEGHALSLCLLGNYLAAVQSGDIRRRDRISSLTQTVEGGLHAAHVMDAYVNWFLLKGDAPPEMAVLLLMGLFDRPVGIEVLDALMADEALQSLTASFMKLHPEQQRYTVNHLQSLDLLRVVPTEGHSFSALTHLSGLSDIHSLDAHPLVREYFGKHFQLDDPDLWQAAHSQLYEYYKSLPEKELPDTLEEMEPLFLAVAHGCKASMEAESFSEIYWKRVLRENEAYTVDKLGAFMDDLSTLSNYFDRTWDRPATILTRSYQTLVLSMAGYRLKSLGRLFEAIQPVKAGLEIGIHEGDWLGAAVESAMLSELYLSLGEVDNAVSCCLTGLDYVNQSGNVFQWESNLCGYAEALYDSGEIELPKYLFSFVEKRHQERSSSIEYLDSLPGFWYSELLIEEGNVKEALTRAKALSNKSVKDKTLFEIALTKLMMGKATSELARRNINNLADESFGFQAHENLCIAISSLREAGLQEYLCRGLLIRAAFYRDSSDFDAAHQDITEIFEIAEQNSMRRYLTDYYLESARLALAESNLSTARTHTEHAAELIEETGYHRRDGELVELREKLR